MIAHSSFRKFLTYMTLSFAVCLAFGLVLVIALELSLPNVKVLRDVHLQMPLRVFSADNKLLAEFGNIKRTPVTLDQVPKQLIQATLATEDQRFYEHSGVDFLGLGRAAVVLLLTGQKQQGGSTITMQVARNYFLTRKKTYTRKLREILLAFKLDHAFTKDKILELYFNKVFYGNRAYGIAAAAQIYYGKKLEDLTLPEMAMLAGLPKAPSSLNPLANQDRAKDRRDHVLHRMYELNMIDQQTYEDAINTPLTAKYHGLKISVKAPYVAEMVRQYMVDQYGDDVYNEGFDVFTTIQSDLQLAANHALNKDLLAYDQRHGYRGPEQNIGKPDPNNLTQTLDTLNNIPAVNGLQPAVVMNVQDQSVDILLKSGETTTIPWNGLKWARKQYYRNQTEYLGPVPQYAAQILKPGDVIRTIQAKNKQWRLAQVPEAEAALVALNPKNGAILSLNGGFNYYKSNFNRILQATRQPGSSFKPFIYSAALEKNFTLASIINDAPVVMADSGENSLWRPENDTRKFYGPTRLRTALDESRNLVSIRLLQMIGIDYAINYVTRFGFNRDQLPPSLSLALGSATVTPLQLASAYAIFANGGYQVKPYFIDQIINYKHQTIYQATPLIAGNDQPINPDNFDVITNQHMAPRVITAQNAYLINSALQDVIKHGTGQAALVLHRHDLAGKTGTTNNKVDDWFSGFNSNIVATVWMGYDNPRPLYEYAARAVLPMWVDFMHAALKGQPEASMPEPSGIVTARIDRDTGLLASASDQNAMFEVFRKGLVPKQTTINSDDSENNYLY